MHWHKCVLYSDRSQKAPRSLVGVTRIYQVCKYPARSCLCIRGLNKYEGDRMAVRRFARADITFDCGIIMNYSSSGGRRRLDARYGHRLRPMQAGSCLLAHCSPCFSCHFTRSYSLAFFGYTQLCICVHALAHMCMCMRVWVWAREYVGGRVCWCAGV